MDSDVMNTHLPGQVTMAFTTNFTCGWAMVTEVITYSFRGKGPEDDRSGS